MATTDKYLVKINIAAGNDACALNSLQEFIHQRELDLVIRHLEDSVSKAKRYLEIINSGVFRFTRVHDTITLAGSRGSGKTSFLLNIQEGFNEQKTDSNYKRSDVETLEKTKKELQFLGIIDPTLIDSKENIFINIITRIIQSVEEQNQDTPGNYGSMNEYKRKQLESWESSLRALAMGLPSIDGIGGNRLNSDEWMDYEYIMDQGIKRERAAIDLEKDFHYFVKRSLDILEKKAFLLCFDDIDTNFEKGLPVLETIRKYLTTPQIIIILTGDMGLYSSIIRQQQWKNFGKEILDYEYKIGRELEKYQSAVTHLEEQYLQKLLKPERRISLNTLYQKEDANSSVIKVRNGDEKEKTLGEFYDEGFKYLGINDSTQRKTFYQFLANLPIRTQKHLLFAIAENIKISGPQNIKSKKENEAKKMRETLEQSILDLFWSDLANKDVEVTILRDHPELMIIHLLKYLRRNNILFEGYNFRPVSDNIILNGAQFAAGVMVSINIKNNSSEMFQYWMRICLSKEIALLIWSRDSVEEKDTNNKPSLDNFINHCDILDKRSIRHVTRNAVSYLKGLQRIYVEALKSDLENNISWIGTVNVRIPFEENIESLESKSIMALKKGLNPVSRTIFSLPLIAVMEHTGRTIPVYSIFNLIGVIGEILETFDGLNIHILKNVKDQKETIDEAKLTIKRILFKDSQYRDYPLPNWFNEKESKAYNYTDFGQSEVLPETSKTEGTGLPEEIPNEIYEWYMSWYPSAVKSKADSPETKLSRIFPAYLFSEIFNRFFFVLSRMDREKQIDNSTKNYMHRMIIAFMHSVLIEEAMEYLEPRIVNNLQLENPLKSDHIFIHNLIKVKQYRHELKLSKWLLSCPLWYYYLDLNMASEIETKKVCLKEALKEFGIKNKLLNTKNIFEEISETLNKTNNNRK